MSADHRDGRVLCGKPGVPGEWGDGDRWVRVEERADESPEMIALRGLFANVGKPLLELLFAWREWQGGLAGWTPKAVRELARFVDRISVDYPNATDKLREAGRDKAITEIGHRIHSLDTAKGRSRELARVRHELQRLLADVGAIGESLADAADDELVAEAEARHASPPLDAPSSGG